MDFTNNIDILFELRKKVGENIINIIKEKGYTKSSFAKLINISRPTLDKIINGEIDNKATFTTHINKILDTKAIVMEQLLNKELYEVNESKVTVVFSDTAPDMHTLKSGAKEMFMVLEDILHLCEIYYE